MIRFSIYAIKIYSSSSLVRFHEYMSYGKTGSKLLKILKYSQAGNWSITVVVVNIKAQKRDWYLRCSFFQVLYISYIRMEARRHSYNCRDHVIKNPKNVTVKCLCFSHRTPEYFGFDCGMKHSFQISEQRLSLKAF